MTLRSDAFALLSAKLAPLGYPIAWPHINFTPPDTGIWLEVMVFDNDPLQDFLANDGPVLSTGFLQVTVFDRPGRGSLPADTAAQAVIAALPKGTRIGTSARVNRHPYRMSEDDTTGDKLTVPVTIPYGP